ncbi:MAG: hypothetical protein AAFU53_01910 [Cyanobacteria bacterium J06632_3]
MFTLLQGNNSILYYGDGGKDTVYSLLDLNNNGDALDMGEASVWFTADNADGLPLLKPTAFLSAVTAQFMSLKLTPAAGLMETFFTVIEAVRSLNGFFPERPRILAYRTSLKDPAAVPEAVLILGLLTTGLLGYRHRLQA